ncbi:MAG: Ig-like domain-containing protein [Verrucomicrobia bacterium]|nr:Ig-like domain-containing protein [Verrucomicrobiota bacterium]
MTAKPGPMAAQIDPGGAKTSVAPTDGNGVATTNRMGGNSVHGYYADGDFVVTATQGASRVSFNLSVVPAGPGDAPQGRQLTIVAGNGQKVPRAGSDVPGGTALFEPLSVALKDGAGKPIPGARLSFRMSGPPAMAIQFSPGGGGAGTTVITDGNGVAILNQMGGKSLRVYYASGPFQVIVTADEAKPATFDLAVVDAPPPPPPLRTEPQNAKLRLGSAPTQLAALSGANRTSGKWSSSDSGIASIDPNGVVTARKPGTATISVDAGTSGQASTTVKVEASSLRIEPQDPKVQLGGPSFVLAVFDGDKRLPPTAGRWTSANPAIGGVAPDGRVTGTKAGTVTVTFEGPMGKVSTTLTLQALALRIEPQDPKVRVGTAPLRLAAFLGSNPASGRWVSSAPGIASIDASGLLTARKPGTAMITFETGGTKGTTKVTIEPSTLRIEPLNPKFVLGSPPLALIVFDDKTPLAPTSGQWASSDSAIGAVNSLGRVDGGKPGKITVTFAGPIGKVSTTVTPVPPEMKIEPQNPTIRMGAEPLQLSASIGSSRTSGRWTSSNAGVASIDATGKVTARKPGTATITVEGAFGGKGSTKVTVAK